MEHAEPRRRRVWIVHVGLVLVAFGLLAWTLRGNWSQIQDVIARRPDARFFAAALAVHVAALCLSFLRWFILVRALGLPFRMSDAIRLGFIGNVFNLVIPGAVGGDLVKAAFLVREQARKTQAVGSMLIDRGIGLLGLFILAGFGGLLEYQQARPEVRTLITLALGAAAAGMVGLLILLTPKLYQPLLHMLARSPRLETFATELVACASGYRQRGPILIAALGLSIIGHILNVSAFALVDQALYGSAAPSFGRHLVIVPLVLFTTAVPLPFGALGLSEKASQSLFDLVRFPGGAVAMMGYRVVMYAGALISALVYAANARQIRQLRAQVEDAPISG